MAILSTLDQAILRTIIYFDIFDYPLTAQEIHSWLLTDNSVEFNKILSVLQNPSRLEIVETAEGFYFLRGKNKNVETRKSRHWLAEQKFRIALKNIRLLRHLPFIKAIFVANRLAYENTTENSDIDLVIITKKNRIWSARFFSALLMKLLNRRPTATNHKNKICLSFFLAEDQLSLKDFYKTGDIHFQYWLKQWQPVFDPENYLEKFWLVNSNIKKLTANFQPNKISDRRSVGKSWVQPILTFFKSLIPEAWYKQLQLKIMPAELKNNRAPNVVLSDQMLKLHVLDRCEEYNQLFEKRCKELMPRVTVVDAGKMLTKIITG